MQSLNISTASTVCSAPFSDFLFLENLLFHFIISVRRQSFSPGLKFEYNENRKNDKMYVKPRHKTLKDEMLNSGFLSMARWINAVELNGRKRIKTDEVKNMKVVSHSGPWPENEKPLREGATISLQHLFALILYCNFSALSTAFAATYRRENVFETIESLIARHSQYAHFGRLLMEVVLSFGHNRSVNGAKGPFYHGIDREMNIGTYAIFLKGPCSTSTERIVALKFATEQGLILTLNNDSQSAEDQYSFDCSWISNFPEEAETLWIASDGPLRIASISLEKSNKCYDSEIDVLYLFDAMISGIWISGKYKINVDDSQLKLISNLMTNSGAMNLDLYLKNEWKLFVYSKKLIILDMFRIYTCFQSLSGLITNNIVKNHGHSVNGNNNMFTTEFVSMFPSLERLVILDCGDFPFSLKVLLQRMISLSSRFTVSVIDGGRWTKRSLTNEISNAFCAAGWNIEYDAELSHATPRVGFELSSGGLMIENKQQIHNKVFRALHLFEALTSGVALRESNEKSPSKSDTKLLSDLINMAVHDETGDSTNLSVDLKNDWNMFVQKKRRVVLDFEQLNEDFYSFSNLLMYNVVNNVHKSATGNDNVFKTEWLSIFPMVESLVILDRYGCYRFRLEALLESIRTVPISVHTVSAIDGGIWTHNALTDDISGEFTAARWNIQYDSNLQYAAKNQHDKAVKAGLLITRIKNVGVRPAQFFHKHNDAVSALRESHTAESPETLINYLDRRLSEYYTSKGRNDYLNDDDIGLFTLYIEMEGFEEESIIDELTGDLEEFGLNEFDDNFPQNDPSKDMAESIFNLLVQFHNEFGTNSTANNVPNKPNVEPMDPIEPETEIQQICQRFSTYYKRHGVAYDQLITSFCEENGFDDLEDLIGSGDKDDLIDVLLPSFPFQSALRTTTTSTNAKRQYIWNLIRTNAEILDPGPLPSFDGLQHLFSVTTEEWTSFCEKYMIQCSTLWSRGVEQDNTFMYGLAVGEKIKYPYLQYLVDDYICEKVCKYGDDIVLSGYATICYLI